MSESERSILRVRTCSMCLTSQDGQVNPSYEHCADIVSVKKDGDMHVAVVRQGDQEATARAMDGHDAIIRAAKKLFEPNGEPSTGDTYVIEGGKSAWFHWVPGRENREPRPAPTHLFAGGGIPYALMQDHIKRLAWEMRPRESSDGTGSPT